MSEANGVADMTAQHRPPLARPSVLLAARRRWTEGVLTASVSGCLARRKGTSMG